MKSDWLNSDQWGNRAPKIRSGKSNQQQDEMPTSKTRPTLSQIQGQFGFPLSQAGMQIHISSLAINLGIGRTLLKQSCRHYSIKRWPYKKSKDLHLEFSRIYLAPINRPDSRHQKLPSLKEVIKMIFDANRPVLMIRK